jgi:hypothetical protein
MAASRRLKSLGPLKFYLRTFSQIQLYFGSTRERRSLELSERVHRGHRDFDPRCIPGHRRIHRLDHSQCARTNRMILRQALFFGDRQHLLIPSGTKVLGEAKRVDTFKGMNQIGDTGLRDQVNNHLVPKHSTRVGESLDQTSQRNLDKFLNILPTVTIRERHRVKIYLSGALAVPDYANRKMPSDI